MADSPLQVFRPRNLGGALDNSRFLSVSETSATLLSPPFTYIQSPISSHPCSALSHQCFPTELLQHPLLSPQSLFEGLQSSRWSKSVLAMTSSPPPPLTCSTPATLTPFGLSKPAEPSLESFAEVIPWPEQLVLQIVSWHPGDHLTD